MVPLLLWLGNRPLGISGNLRHLCAALPGSKPDFLRYEWRTQIWNLLFAAGLVLGGWIGGHWLADPDPFVVAATTRADLAAIGVTRFDAMVPVEIFSWDMLGTARGLVILIGGGFLVGFGARYAGGCTSGHGVAGLADLQIGSLVAVVGFFIGGLIATFLLLPRIW